MKKVVMLCLIFILTASAFSAIFPYPVFSNHTNINEKNAFEINNFYESELKEIYNSKTKLLDLDFDDINVLIPNGQEIEIYDINTQTIFQVVRTGGNHHIDVEPIDKINTQIMGEIVSGEWNWNRCPVIVKLTENAYISASIVYYPHGYNTIKNDLTGHFCLHFKGSKTDGTEEEDYNHQKQIKKTKQNFVAF